MRNEADITIVPARCGQTSLRHLDFDVVLEVVGIGNGLSRLWHGDQ